MLLPIVFGVLVAHCLGDFFVQTRWMALNKSKSNRALLYHIGSYTITLFLCLLIFMEMSPLRFSVSGPLLLAYCLLNGALHFGVDYVTSRLSSRFHSEGRMDAFWRVIGVDQLAHSVCLLATLSLLRT